MKILRNLQINTIKHRSLMVDSERTKVLLIDADSFILRKFKLTLLMNKWKRDI